MLSLAYPWVLLLLPLAWLVRRFIPPAPPRLQTALSVPFFNRIAALSKVGLSSPQVKKYKLILVYVIWILLVFAASGPQWVGAPVHLPKSGRNIMLIVDLSGSMQVPDLTLQGTPSTRLDVVKSVAEQFIHDRVGDRLGLVLFGARAYLQTPLTFDRQTVSDMLNDATLGLAGDQTAIGDAVGLAVKSLLQVPKSSRVIVLLTDGGNNAGTLLPLQAARLATQAGIKIYTIGIGADSLVVQSTLGPKVINPSSDLDQNTLKQMADMTGGLFFRAKDTSQLKAAYATLDRVEPVASGAGIFRPTKTFFQWPLSMAFLLALSLWASKLSIFAQFLPRMSFSMARTIFTLNVRKIFGLEKKLIEKKRGAL